MVFSFFLYTGALKKVNTLQDEIKQWRKEVASFLSS